MAPPGLLHIDCEVRKTSGVHEDVFALPKLDSNISGMINCALALRSGASMVRFRSCLRQEVMSRLHIRYGLAPAGAKEYKRKALA